jgi:hypothetical protein
MFRNRTLLFLLAAASAQLFAEDFRPIVKAACVAFPGRTHFGVVCDYSQSRAAVDDLVRALPMGSTLTVVDTHDTSQVVSAGRILSHREVGLLALLPHDTLVRDGSVLATILVKQIQARIPAFGTTPAAIENGCALALGEKTDWQLLVNPKVLDPSIKGTIGPIEITPETTAASTGQVTMRVVSIFDNPK